MHKGRWAYSGVQWSPLQPQYGSLAKTHSSHVSPYWVQFATSSWTSSLLEFTYSFLCNDTQCRFLIGQHHHWPFYLNTNILRKVKTSSKKNLSCTPFFKKHCRFPLTDYNHILPYAYDMIGGELWNSCVTHRGRVKGDAEDVGFVVESSILGDDKGLTFVLDHLVNPSIICLKTQGEKRWWLNTQTCLNAPQPIPHSYLMFRHLIWLFQQSLSSVARWWVITHQSEALMWWIY